MIVSLLDKKPSREEKIDCDNYVKVYMKIWKFLYKIFLHIAISLTHLEF